MFGPHRRFCRRALLAASAVWVLYGQTGFAKAQELVQCDPYANGWFTPDGRACTPLPQPPMVPPAYGGAMTSPTYGGPATPPGYGGPVMMPGYGGPAMAPGYGGPAMAPGYGGPAMPSGYGGPIVAPGYGGAVPMPQAQAPIGGSAGIPPMAVQERAKRFSPYGR
jgi:hypothetical protein